METSQQYLIKVEEKIEMKKNEHWTLRTIAAFILVVCVWLCTGLGVYKIVKTFASSEEAELAEQR